MKSGTARMRRPAICLEKKFRFAHKGNTGERETDPDRNGRHSVNTAIRASACLCFLLAAGLPRQAAAGEGGKPEHVRILRCVLAPRADGKGVRADVALENAGARTIQRLGLRLRFCNAAGKTLHATDWLRFRDIAPGKTVSRQGRIPRVPEHEVVFLDALYLQDDAPAKRVEALDAVLRGEADAGEGGFLEETFFACGGGAPVRHTGENMKRAVEALEAKLNRVIEDVETKDRPPARPGELTFLDLEVKPGADGDTVILRMHNDARRFDPGQLRLEIRFLGEDGTAATTLRHTVAAAVEKGPFTLRLPKQAVRDFATWSASYAY